MPLFGPGRITLVPLRARECLLTCGDGNRKPVLGRRNRAASIGIVGELRVVGEIEVQHQAAVTAVEQI